MNLMFLVVRTTINLGATERFRNTVAEVVRIAKAASPGLVAYEWFLSRDGRECTVVEAFEGPAAHANHVQQVVLPHASKLREYSSSQISLAGNVPDEMMTQMRTRLGNVPYLGTQIAGVLAAPANTESKPDGVTACVVVTGNIAPDKAQVVRVIADAAVRDLAGNGDIVAHEWFLNPEIGSFSIIRMCRTPALALDCLPDTLSILKTAGASNITLDALGLDSSEVTKRFRNASIGRVGGEKIEGIL